MSGDYTYGQSVSVLGDDVAVVRYAATDTLPTTISVTIAGYQKRIAWIQSFSPRELSEVQARIMAVSGVDRWLK